MVLFASFIEMYLQVNCLKYKLEMEYLLLQFWQFGWCFVCYLSLLLFIKSLKGMLWGCATTFKCVLEGEYLFVLVFFRFAVLLVFTDFIFYGVVYLVIRRGLRMREERNEGERTNLSLSFALTCCPIFSSRLYPLELWLHTIQLRVK